MASNVWAVLTGAGSGIGLALAEQLAINGIHVVTVGRRAAALEAAQAQSAQPDRLHPLAADITTEAGREAIAKALPPSARLQFLIHNAAVGPPAAFPDVSLAAFEESLATNVTAPLFLTQRLLARLEPTGSDPSPMPAPARILHVTTSIAHKAQLGATCYGVSKAAFNRLTAQLQLELRGPGPVPAIAVGSASPGVVDTEGLREHIRLAEQRGLPHVAYFRKLEMEGNGVIGSPAERAGRFLAYLLQGLPVERFAEREWHIEDAELLPMWDATAGPRSINVDPALRFGGTTQQ